MIINTSRLLIAACLLTLCGGSSSIFAAAQDADAARDEYTYLTICNRHRNHEVKSPFPFVYAPNNVRVNRRGSLETQNPNGTFTRQRGLTDAQKAANIERVAVAQNEKEENISMKLLIEALIYQMNTLSTIPK